MVHQILAEVKSTAGITHAGLLKLISGNPAFVRIETNDSIAIIEHLTGMDFLEEIQGELIIGVDGEKIVNRYDFYSVFTTPEVLKVVNAGNTIGEIPFSPQIREDENILLAAKVWKIKFVDIAHKRIEVVKTQDGKKPIFGGSLPDIHPRIRQKMLEIVYSQEDYAELNKEGNEALQELRSFFKHFSVMNFTTDRPVQIKDNKCLLYSFTGSRINRTLEFIFRELKIPAQLIDHSSSLGLPISYAEFNNAWTSRNTVIDNIEHHLEIFFNDNPDTLGFSKWGSLLPRRFQLELLKEQYFDFQSLKEAHNWRFVTNTSA